MENTSACSSLIPRLVFLMLIATSLVVFPLVIPLSVIPPTVMADLMQFVHHSVTNSLMQPTYIFYNCNYGSCKFWFEIFLEAHHLLYHLTYPLFFSTSPTHNLWSKLDLDVLPKIYHSKQFFNSQPLGLIKPTCNI